MKITRAVRHARKRITALTAAAAAAGLLVTAGMASSAHASAGTTTASGPKPSIVLVHGAWADSSSWDAVVSQLQHDGYTVYVPPNPLLGISYVSAFIREFLHTISGPIILVGHSYGGTGDHAIPPAELLAMAQQARAHITIIPGAPHLSMISNPGIITRVILAAVHATS